MKDAIGNDIKLGSTIVHACSSYGHRVSMQTGVVTKLRHVEQQSRRRGNFTRDTIWYDGPRGLCFARDSKRVVVVTSPVANA